MVYNMERLNYRVNLFQYIIILGGFRMKVLVVNCGSSSIKYQLINMENESVMAKGYLEKIGLPDSFLTHTVNGEKNVKLKSL